MLVIYKAEFPNGKVYIGKTKNFEIRKMGHFYNSNYKKTSYTKMKNAINKYGFDNINWSILFECEDAELINDKEKEYIIHYDSIKSGYNISVGGDGGDTISNNERRIDIIKQQLKSKGMDPDKYVVLTEELTKSILVDYTENNFSIRALVRKYLITKQRITRLFISENIVIDKNKSYDISTKTFTNDYVTKIIDMYKNGFSIKSIAENEKMTIMIISRILHDSGTRISKRFKDGKRYDGRQPKNKTKL